MFPVVVLIAPVAALQLSARSTLLDPLVGAHALAQGERINSEVQREGLKRSLTEQS